MSNENDLRDRKLAALIDLAKVFKKHGVSAWSSECGALTIGKPCQDDEGVIVDIGCEEVSFIDIERTISESYGADSLSHSSLDKISLTKTLPTGFLGFIIGATILILVMSR